jgi:hypothetical protein
MRTLSILLCLFFVSCLPDPVPLDIEQLPTRPVIWSQALGTNGALVYMGRTFSALEFSGESDTLADEILDELLVNDALITLSTDGQTDTLIALTDGLFAALNIPIVPGSNYSLRATDLEKNLTATAQTRALAPANFLDVSYERMADSTLRFQLRFTEPAEQNWYAVHFYTRFSDPLLANNPLSSNGSVRTFLLSDLELENNEATAIFDIPLVDSDTLFVSLNNIDENFYNYMQQRERGGNLFSQTISEPITYPTNIINGFGVFTLHFPQIRIVVIDP